jgi:hypothetical protein
MNILCQPPIDIFFINDISRHHYQFSLDGKHRLQLDFYARRGHVQNGLSRVCWYLSVGFDDTWIEECMCYSSTGFELDLS